MQVKLRGESMQAAADAAESGMVSVIGLDADTVAELCDAADQQVGTHTMQVANFLCPGNYVVSGSKEVRTAQLCTSDTRTPCNANRARSHMQIQQHAYAR